MRSSASDVSAYFSEVPAERQAAMARLRALCRTRLKGFEESIQYDGPCYSRDGVVEAGFASQKRFIGLYILRLDVLNAHRAMPDGPGVSLARIIREGADFGHCAYRMVTQRRQR